MSSKKIYCEKINVSKAQYLIENAEEYGLHTKKKSYDKESQLTLLKKYVKKAQEGQGIIYQAYHYATGSHGRRYSDTTSLQGLCKMIRHTIAKEFYRDIDIANCHPVILEHYCKTNNIRCSNLSYYIQNREECLKEIMSSMDITRDVAKNCFLKPINYEHPNQKLIDEYGDKVPVFFINYSNELTSNIIPKIQELNPELAKEAVVKRPHNVGGSTLNRLMCSIENNILETIEDVCLKNNIDVGVLCFDGAMIDKNSDIDFLIPVLEDEIFKKHNIKLKIVEKEMTENIDIPEQLLKKQQWEIKQEKEKEKQKEKENKQKKKEDKEREKEEKEKEKQREKDLKKEQKQREKEYKIQQEKERVDNIEKEYLCLKEKFEEKHAKIIESSNFVMKNDKDSIIQMTKTQLSDSYQHIRFAENESFIRRWLNDEDIKVYKRMECIPVGINCPDDIYNLWTPFDCEQITLDDDEKGIEEETEFMINHIKILCNKEEKLYDYVLKWISQMLRFPQHKTRLITFISEEGAGKGSVVELLTKILGSRHVLTTSRPSRDVWGNFNDLMTGETYLVVLNELEKKETLEAEEKIKELITDPTITINPKGRTQYTINSYHRFLALTNRDEPMNVSKNDRRKVIIRCNDELIGNTEHFNRFRNNLNNKNVIRSIYEWFINYKPKEVEVFHQLKNDEVPITDYQKELTEINLNYPELFIKFLTYETCMFDQILGMPQDDGYKECSVGDLGAKIPEFRERYNIKFEANAIALGVRISRLKINGIEKVKKASGSYYKFNKEKIIEHFENLLT